MNKKSLITIIIFILCSALITTAVVLLINRNPDQETEPAMSEYSIFRENILSKLAPDQIPPIESPKYVATDKAYFLDDDDKVFVLEADEGIFVYPHKILVWHEVVNEKIDGEAISVTYCPLTGSVIGYKGNTGDSDENTFGTSGSLINSNLVLYDRDTNSLIPQILGIGIDSELEGFSLETVPIHWANWKDVKVVFPEAKVLTLDTGFQRDYFEDPYGSYSEDGTDSYYQSGEPFYIVLNKNDGTFSDKKSIIGVKANGLSAAINPDSVRAAGSLKFTIGKTHGSAIHDKELDVIRVFHMDGDKVLTDQPMTYFEVMWFAWYAYYPDTIVIDK